MGGCGLTPPPPRLLLQMNIPQLLNGAIPSPTLVANVMNILDRGALYLTGENLEVVWAKFSTVR
jgi:hypothetical protein